MFSTDDYTQFQEQYLQKLKELQKRKDAGEDISEEQAEIRKRLQDAGILDENGEIVEIYRK